MSETNQQTAAPLLPIRTPAMGECAVDRITGIKGTATAFCYYISGRTEVLIERVDADGKPQADWTTIERLTTDPSVGTVTLAS